jgi:hypothetical protein
MFKTIICVTVGTFLGGLGIVGVMAGAEALDKMASKPRRVAVHVEPEAPLPS